jgi:hypothetical protein
LLYNWSDLMVSEVHLLVVTREGKNATRYTFWTLCFFFK